MFTIPLLSALATSFLCLGPVKSAPISSLTYITLEEHVLVPALTNSNGRVASLVITPTQEALQEDTDTRNGPRLQSMNANNIRVQVMSAPPNPLLMDQASIIRQGNDQLARIVAVNPSRFASFCSLPMALPRLAAIELERCVKQLGMKGALIDNHLYNYTWYDGSDYLPVWEMAQKLDVPIYLHPTYPPAEEVLVPGSRLAPAGDDFSVRQAVFLGTFAWDWHADTGYHFLRLYSAGLFERFPRLKLVLGHMGEIVPYMLERSTNIISAAPPQLSLQQTWERNVWVTTSGFFGNQTIATLFRTTAKDRIMYSVDYPFSANELGTRFMNNLRTSGEVTPAEWAGIAYGNAQKLLQIPTA